MNHEPLFLSSQVQTAKTYAVECHEQTNHTYDGQSYSVHLQMVYSYGCKYAYLLPENEIDAALAACWTHDTIEDTRQTYNDVKAACGEAVAEIVYALTNEKGKNRKERANEKYYNGIRNTPPAAFVKICDRLANVKYSKQKNSRMLDAYKKEFNAFKNELWLPGFKPMFDELSELLS